MTLKNEGVKKFLDVGEILKSGWITIVGWVLFCGVTYGIYTTNDKWNQSKFEELRSMTQKIDGRIAQQEQFGHPDHERRIQKLENRADATDSKFSELNGKVDTSIAIQNRIEAKVADVANKLDNLKR